MDDNPDDPPPSVDLSPYILNLDIEYAPMEIPATDAAWLESQRLGTFTGTITGTFVFETLPPRLTCPLCGLAFALPTLDGHPYASITIEDGPAVPICDACAITLCEG